MKAAIYEGIEKIVIKDVPKPVCGAENILIKVHSCAICGTDVRTYHHGKSNIKPPQILGHEVAGVVAEAGREVKNFKAGDKVAVAAIVSCGNCDYCKRGLQNLCRNFTAIGYEHAGGFAEFMLVPSPLLKDGSVNKIPDELSFDEASIAEPFACAINGQEISNITSDDIVAIIGAGPIGCMHLALAKSKKAKKVIMIDISSSRLETAGKFNADVYIDSLKEDVFAKIKKETDNNGADVIIIAASSAKAADLAVKIANFRARIDFFAGFPKDNPVVNIDGNVVHYKELIIHGSSGSLPRHNQEALRLFSSGKVNAKQFITNIFSLDKIVEGIKTVESRDGLKVVIHP